MADNAKLRKKKKYTCPNPLFVRWLTEWKQEAADKGLKTQYTYAKALLSLKKYPLPLSSGKEAKILEFFGDKICSMLDAKLLEWKQSTALPTASQSSSSIAASQSSSSSTASTSSYGSTSSVAKKPVVPRTTSTNIQVISVKTTGIQRTVCSHVSAMFKPAAQPMVEETPSFELHPGQFRVLLCVDNCETSSGHGKSKKQFLAEFQKSNVEFEVRKLHVGDFLWVARDNQDSSRELVLDFVVERKRMDDLAHSIKDGRFKEQKFRMKNSGVRNPVYLVENCGGAKYLGLPESTLEQAMVNTQIIDGFLVKRTQGIKDSVSYLSMMTKKIRNKYQNQKLVSGSRAAMKGNSSNVFLSFNEFNSSSVKNKALTVKEMFAKQLMQLFGLSVDRAAAIVSCYSTPTLFLEAYNKCITENERIQMVSSIKYGLHKKNIGPTLSRSLFQFYGSEH